MHEVRADEVATVYGALARAFEDDPVTAFLFPEGSSRIDRLLAFYRVTTPWLAEQGRFFTDAGLRGGAIWQAPRPAQDEPRLQQAQECPSRAHPRGARRLPDRTTT